MKLFSTLKKCLDKSVGQTEIDFERGSVCVKQWLNSV